MNQDSFTNLATLLLFLVLVATIYSLESSLCDFEDQNICGYTQDLSDDFNWTRFSGPTSSYDTGPDYDHTFASSVGHYMYIEASYAHPNETARLISPVYQPTPQPQCLEFWYHMHGRDIGTLRVYFQQDGIIGSPNFTVKGDKGNTWLFGQIETPAKYPAFQVVFEGVNGNNYRGDIGIDDIKVKPLSCATVPAGPDDVALTPKMLTYSTKEGSAVPDVVCSCSGCVPNCSVIWSFNGVDVDNTSTLQLSTVSRFSSGRYTCACVNPATMAMRSVSFDLDVKYGPLKVVLSPTTTNYVTVEGRPLPDIDCSCGLCSPSCQVHWLYKNSSVGNTSTLQLYNISRTMAGEYSCHCENPDTHDEITSEVKIFVEYGPDRIEITPANTSYVIVEQNRTRLDVVCSCGDCVPSCSSEWLLNGTVFSNSDPTLELNNISRSDTGVYTCMCKNMNTKETENKQFVLTVLYGPDNVFLTPSKTIYSTTVGSHLENIDCSCGECHPSCTVKWTRLRNAISNTSVLDLGRLSLLDSGEYDCTCSNTETREEETSGFQLTVHALPDVHPCPETTDDWGTTWNTTHAGDVITAHCTRDGYTGTMSRECSKNGQWEVPIYDCVQASIAVLEKKLEEFSKNISTAELSPILEELVNISNTKDNADGSMYPRELESVTNALNVVAKLADSGHPLTEAQSRSFVSTASNLLNAENDNSWKSLSKSKQDGAAKLLQVVDKLSGAMTKGMNGPNTTTVRIVQQNIVLEASKVSENQEEIIFPVPSSKSDSIPISGAKLSLPLKDSHGHGPKTYTAVLYKRLSGILPNTINHNKSTESNNNLELNTAVVSLQVFPDQATLPRPLEITFKRLNVHYRDGVCSYWNFNMTRWETNGCHVKSSTRSSVVCECNHMTNFAVLMSPWQEPSTDSRVIEVISIIGCSVSIICLIATAALHILLWRNVKNDRAVILLNISIALIATYVIFLAGINRISDQATCRTVAALLHYTLLVVFCLMLAEGVEITISVKYVFLTKSRLRWMLPLSWGIPAVIVGISMGISRLKGYGTEHFCWLSVETGVIWAFVGPAMVIIVVNLAFLGVLLRTMLKTKAYVEMTEIDRIKSSVRCLCVLVPLMGGTWVLGIFYVNEGSKWIQYVFAICNSLQGFFIFLFHGLLNKQVHTAIKSRHKKYKDSHSVVKGSHSLSKSLSMKRKEITDTTSLNSSPSTKRINRTSEQPLNKSRSTKRTKTTDTNSLNKSDSTKWTEIKGSPSLDKSPNMDRTEITGVMNPTYIPTIAPASTVQGDTEKTTAGTLPFSTVESLAEEPDQMKKYSRKRSWQFKQCGKYSPI